MEFSCYGHWVRHPDNKSDGKDGFRLRCFQYYAYGTVCIVSLDAIQLGSLLYTDDIASSEGLDGLFSVVLCGRRRNVRELRWYLSLLYTTVTARFECLHQLHWRRSSTSWFISSPGSVPDSTSLPTGP